MSTWITPKTNWKPTDYINLGDWDRIINNMNFLKNAAEKLYGTIAWKDMGTEKNYEDFPNADEWNCIEINLMTLNQYLCAIEIGKPTVFYNNGPMINYVELNRIESTMFQYAQMLIAQSNSVPTLAFIFGTSVFDK